MKFMNKTLCAVLALVGVTNVAFGYDFSFKNNTKKDVAVKLNLAASLEDFDGSAVVKPGETHKFSFGGLKSGFCLSNISYGALDEGSLNQSYPEFVEAAEYMSISAGQLSMNVCKNLDFDITDVYGGGVTIKRAGE